MLFKGVNFLPLLIFQNITKNDLETYIDNMVVTTIGLKCLCLKTKKQQHDNLSKLTHVSLARLLSV